MSLVVPDAVSSLAPYLRAGRDLYNDPKVRRIAAIAMQRIARGGMARSQFRAAKKAQSYKAKARRQTGEDIVGDTAKATRIRSDGAQLYATNVPYFNDPIQIDRRTTTSYLLNQRERDLIYLSGIKICLTVWNNLAATAGNELYFNVALLSAKNQRTIGATDFFRCYTGAKRGMDFTDAALTPHERYCLPINADEHVVHWHHRKILVPGIANQDSGTKEVRPYEITKYVPIKRQIRFESGTSGGAITLFRVVWWVGRVGATAALASEANALSVDHKFVTHFREPEVVTNFSKKVRV